jgi:hypothetical protein
VARDAGRRSIRKASSAAATRHYCAACLDTPSLRASAAWRALYRAANPTYCLPASKWANPFKLRRNATAEERAEANRNCELRLRDERADLIAALAELRGKDLVCWCAPFSVTATCCAFGERLTVIRATPSPRKGHGRLSRSIASICLPNV